MLRLLKAAALAAVTFAPQAALGAEPVTIKVLSVLDRFEPFEGHVYHAGRLWVGRSRKDLGAFYRLEVYDGAGTQVANKELDHSLRYIYPYGESSVLIVGIGLDQLSHYTIATLAGNGVELDPHTIPLGPLADRFAGAPGHLIFSDPGGFDDPDHPTPIGQPLQTLFTLGSGNSEARWLAPHIGGPGNGILLGQSLWLLSAPTIESGGKYLHQIALAGEADHVVVGPRNQLVDMISIDGGKTLALAEAGASQILLVDTAGAGRLARTLKIAGGRPRALAEFGKCLLVGTEDTKQVLFFDLSAPSDQPMATWDLSAAGQGFYGLRDLAVDPKTGTVYARSAYPCSPMATMDQCPDHNSVLMVTPSGPSTTSATCLGH